MPGFASAPSTAIWVAVMAAVVAMQSAEAAENDMWSEGEEPMETKSFAEAVLEKYKGKTIKVVLAPSTHCLTYKGTLIEGSKNSLTIRDGSKVTEINASWVSEVWEVSK